MTLCPKLREQGLGYQYWFISTKKSSLFYRSSSEAFFLSFFTDKQQECDVPLYSAFGPSKQSTSVAQPQQLHLTNTGLAATTTSTSTITLTQDKDSSSKVPTDQTDTPGHKLKSGPMGVISGVKADLVKPVPQFKSIPRFGVETSSEDETKLEEVRKISPFLVFGDLESPLTFKSLLKVIESFFELKWINLREEDVYSTL